MRCLSICGREEGRRAAFTAVKERLAANAGRGEEPGVARIEPDPEQFESTRGWGRRAWPREADKELLRRREQDGKPSARSRAERLLEALHRLEEDRQVEIQASDADERWQAQRRAGGVPGQRLGMPPKPYTPSLVPEDVMNKTDPDSRDDAHPGTADRAGLSRASRGHSRADHPRRRDRCGEPSAISNRPTARRCASSKTPA
jgi:hypothetical protein